MAFLYRVRIRGPLACFTRPEFKTERFSYDVLTPSAARGVLEAILWKPAIRWEIRRILLLSPPRYVQFKRNEVTKGTSVASALRASRSGTPLDYFADEDRAQRNTVALRDVDSSCRPNRSHAPRGACGLKPAIRKRTLAIAVTPRAGRVD